MSPRPFDDDAIILQAIERIRMGDSDAFNVIFEGCHVVIQSLCRARLRWADRCIHYEEDLASEILTAIWLTIRDPKTTWNSGADIWHAILRIAFERGINRARYMNRTKRSTVLDLATLFREIHGHRDIASEFEVVDIEDTFEQFRKVLPDDESKELMTMKLCGLRNDQIADQKNVDVRTIQRRIKILKMRFDQFDTENAKRDAS